MVRIKETFVVRINKRTYISYEIFILEGDILKMSMNLYIYIIYSYDNTVVTG